MFKRGDCVVCIGASGHGHVLAEGHVYVVLECRNDIVLLKLDGMLHTFRAWRFRLVTNADRTEWFPEDVDPVHEGFYERDYGEQSLLDYWTGSEWRYGAGGGSTYAFYTACDRLPWRGLKQGVKVAA